jgi:hypothetical protein
MANNIELPAGNGDLEFVYTGLSFAAPKKVRFKVKLEGFDNEWIEAGARRWASYTNIPPGKYKFRVISGFDEGVWNEQGASFSFTLSPHFYQTTWFYLLCATIIAAVSLGGHLLYRRDRNRELIASQLESQLAQAQLQVLKMQLDPHFLFNTLNGIMVLIQDNPEAARRTVARLSEFLRLTLENAGVQEVPMQKELEFLDRYVQIEQLRFGNRLTVQQDVQPGALGGLVPSLILQPLVENAIRHGVAERRGPAMIQIQAARDNGHLVIHVRDNGGGFPSVVHDTFKEGIGLTNTRQRLHRLYGEQHVFELRSLEGGGVDVFLSIPYHEEGMSGVRGS